MAEKRTRGRPPTPFSSEYVLDIAEQTLIAFYNTHDEILQDKLAENPDFARTIRSRATKLEALVRKVLRAHQSVPLEYPSNVSDILFLVYIADLEDSPKLLAAGLKTNEHIYRERAEAYRGPVISILQAKTRVDRKDFLFLDNPFTGVEDEEF